jgi:predicted transposase/invertase (TIGR01784 family)
MSKSKKSSLKPHDRLFKLLLSDPQNLKDFIKLFFPKNLVKHIDLSSLQIIPHEKISLPQKKRKILDLLVKCKLKKTKRPLHLYFLFEHKSKPEKYAFVQIIYYKASLWEENLRKGEDLVPVIAVMFYHGKPKWIYPLKFAEFFDVPGDIKRYLLDFEYMLFNTDEIGDEELLRRIELSNILIFGIYLMKNAWRGKEFIKEGLKVFLEGIEEFEERHKIYFKEFLIYILEVGVIDEEELEEILFKEGGEKVKTIVEKWIDKWIQQGIQQGIEQGLILEAQDMVLSAIEARLGYVPEEVAKKVKEIFDREKLRKALKEIVKNYELEIVFKKYFNL